jgi:hypothetical protein
MTIRLPEAGRIGGREHRGRFATGWLLLRVLWHSRGTLRMEPRSVEAAEDDIVVARTHNTARRGQDRLDLEMTLRFEVRDGRIAVMEESGGRPRRLARVLGLAAACGKPAVGAGPIT